MKKSAKAAVPDQQALLNIFRELGRPIRAETVQRLANVPKRGKKELDKLLQSMVSRLLLDRRPGGFYSLPQNSVCVIGEFAGLPNGAGLVRALEPASLAGRELYVPPHQVNGAWNRDVVRASLLSGHDGDKGKILEIVERRQEIVPAILEEKRKRSLIFHAGDGRLAARFRVDTVMERDAHAKCGQLALLRPRKQLEHGLWQADLLKWRGPANSIAAQEEIVKLSRDVPGAFPELALAQAGALHGQPDAADMQGREDLRHIDFVTIDGVDARDFDDAIQVEATADGYLLRVAIADVSHYVLPDTRPGSLDQEARARGNSWYFPSSCEPMLPPALCNGLCSLRPNEDRLAMLAEMPFSKSGQPLPPRFAPIVMRSRARLIYGDVAKFFAGDSSEVANSSLGSMLKTAHELYEILARKRRERGALDFEMPEAEYEFDAEGHLVAMRDAERTDANRLIEEFMIAANEAVATYLGGKDVNLLYRIHPEPEPDKLQRLLETLKLTAVEILPARLLKAETMEPADIQEILLRAAGAPQEYVVNRLCLRSMAQARYQPRNIGHFGLASPAYCHFTSPIRRYADLLAHRALKVGLGRQDITLPDGDQLAGIGDELNGLERRAGECEREMTKRMACLALQGKEGQKLCGVISGVTDFGIFVEFADLPADGLMRMEELGDEWFEVDQPRQLVVDQRSGRVWRLGQPVEVVLISVDVEKQEIRLKPFGSGEKRKRGELGRQKCKRGAGAGREQRRQRRRQGIRRAKPERRAPSSKLSQLTSRENRQQRQNSQTRHEKQPRAGADARAE